MAKIAPDGKYLIASRVDGQSIFVHEYKNAQHREDFKNNVPFCPYFNEYTLPHTVDVEVTPAVPAVYDEMGTLVTAEVPAVTEKRGFDPQEAPTKAGVSNRESVKQAMYEALEAHAWAGYETV